MQAIKKLDKLFNGAKQWRRQVDMELGGTN